MPRYYFDLRGGDALAVDEEGLQLKNLQRAKDEAARVLAKFAAGRKKNPAKAYLCETIIELRDEQGCVVEIAPDIPTKH